jgi:hypothetical protein
VSEVAWVGGLVDSLCAVLSAVPQGP